MYKAIFCDWKTGNPNLKKSHFFELEDLKGYDILFFDPMMFAYRVGLRNNIDDLWDAEYVPRNEMEFVRYLAKVKAISSKIKSFLNEGGIWVIRSNFPNSHIRMSKRSGSDPGKYTETLISAFFWMEQFIGKYSFSYTTDNSVYFRDKKNAIFRRLHKYGVACRQTQDQIPVPGVKIIAETMNAKKLPTITGVKFGNDGEIYFIPYFDVDDESETLAKTFGELLDEKKRATKRPDWLVSYEDKLNFVSPYIGEIKDIEATIGQLRRRKLTAQQKQTELMTFADLLYTERDALCNSVEAALRLLDFQFPEKPPDVKKAGFTLFASDDLIGRIPIHVFASQKESLDSGALNEFKGMVAHLETNPRSKPVLIINAPYAESPETRLERFPAELPDYAKSYNICILTTLQLFNMVCHTLRINGSDDIGSVKQSLRKDILGTSGLFEFRTDRYKSNVSSKL